MQAFELTPLMLEIIDLVESGQIGEELDAKVALLVSEGPTYAQGQTSPMRQSVR